MTYLSRLTDEELLSHFYNGPDPILANDMQRCLAERLTRRVEEAYETELLIKDLERNFETAMNQHKEVKAILAEFGFVKLDQIRSKLNALADLCRK